MISFSSKRLSDFFKSALHDLTITKISNKVKQTPAIRRRSAEQITVFYQGVTKDGLLRFMCPSGTTPGKFWIQQVSLVHLDVIRKRYPNKKFRDVVALAVKKDVKLFCNDPSFLYWGYKYIAWTQGFGLREETRRPDIRNPKLRGSVCKHLDAVLREMPKYIDKIAEDLTKAGLDVAQKKEATKATTKKATTKKATKKVTKKTAKKETGK